jgi:hypothetical protein
LLTSWFYPADRDRPVSPKARKNLDLADITANKLMDINMSKNSLIRFDEVYGETEPIAVIKLQPRELEQKHRELKFQKGYGDLDYLEYVRLEVMSDRTIALISH